MYVSTRWKDILMLPVTQPRARVLRLVVAGAGAGDGRAATTASVDYKWTT